MWLWGSGEHDHLCRHVTHAVPVYNQFPLQQHILTCLSFPVCWHCACSAHMQAHCHISAVCWKNPSATHFQFAGGVNTPSICACSAYMQGHYHILLCVGSKGPKALCACSGYMHCHSTALKMLIHISALHLDVACTPL